MQMRQLAHDIFSPNLIKIFYIRQVNGVKLADIQGAENKVAP